MTPKKIPVIYVAGPIRDETAWGREQNIRRAEGLALEVWQAGGAGVCMHSMTRYYCEKDASYETWMAGDMEILSRCDAVLLTPDWEKSPGARAEVEFARCLGIPVLHTAGAMRLFVGPK